jgi:hypothetical protein
MRRLVAVLIVALMAGPAFAQIGGMNLLDVGNNRKKSQEDIDREQAADEAYKSAMKKVPDQKKATNDPWADVRGTSQPPATVQKPARSSASNKPN